MLSVQATSVSLTMDLWTACNWQGYLRVICSYINQSFKLCEFTLDMAYVRYPHTSAHIKDTLVNILNEWNICEKVYIITTDNASKGMKPAEILIARTKQLIDFFMRPKQSECLEDTQKKFPGLLNELERKIALQNEEDNEQDEQDIIDPSNTSAYLHTIADTPICWNSSYMAWNRLLLLKNHINVVLNMLGSQFDQDSKKDYKTLQTTDLLGGSNYCAFSIINPILTQIKKQFVPSASHNVNHDYDINFQDEKTAFDDIIDDDDQQFTANSQKLKLKNPINTRGMLNKIKSALYISINHYWKNFTKPDVLLASLLDPKMKDLSFVSSEKRNEIKNLLREKYNEMHTNPTSQPIQPIRSQAKKKKNALLASLKKLSTRSCDEVDEYFQLEEIDLESNPFTWWHEQEEKFPILSFLAKKYLSAYACSTASERLFLDAGNLLTAKKTRIGPSLFKKLIFLKRNTKHLDSIHKPDDSD
ncbi:zinc finger BED domain-containing protein 4-like [Rhizophagus clarus]|uniref:Zinc finger BED domain-containing protein 4-like n=2 Tax=Rhizophagus clarus TaxID=94130 RepID=A0A8H3LWC8_9GLOM|nr:zinc finger BED domain-containing protein 4-like [Rhizophagus clarus]